jgi:two-component system KDP operon response regulator KdpE
MVLETSRVLVVDDEQFFREAIRESLTKASIDCLTADGDEEALELARQPGVGVVVLDVGLPGAGGIELLRKLDAERPALRVIVVAAQTDQDMVVEALRSGACDYLAKPLHDEELVLAVRRALQGFGMQTHWEALQSRLGALEDSLLDLTAISGTDADLGESGATLSERVVQAVSKVLGASKTSLMLLDEDSGSLRPVAATGQGRVPNEMDVMAVGQGVAGLALLNGEPLVVPDVASDERFADRIVEGRYRTNSFAVVPFYSAGHPLGVLCATERENDEPFGPADRSLLRVLALQVGPLIAQPHDAAPQPHDAAPQSDDLTPLSDDSTPPSDDLTPLSDDLTPLSSDAAEREAAIVERLSDTGGGVDDAELARAICDAVTAEIEPDRLLEAALAAVATTTRADLASLYLVSRDGRELLLEGQCDRAGRGDRPRLPAHVGLTGTVFQTGQLVATDAPDGDARFTPEVDTPAGGTVGPFLCAPVRVRAKILGVVRVFPSDGTHAFARTGEILMASMSAAVRNVLMYRSLLESVDEVARARREARTQS